MRFTSLSIALTGDEPPSEFRIFAAGANETKKGTFTFDADAAKSVMAEYKAHGADIPLDYDHAMLGSGHAPDPAQAGKAAGWFNLEVRNGELWAVNVRWTEPAAEALRRKEWRYMSPAFRADEGRVTSLLNVAITNLPATRRLEPLMAASDGGGMTLEEFIKVCKALGIDMTTPLADAMAKIKGDPAPDADKDTEDAPPPKGDGGADETTETADKPAPADKPADKPEEVAAALSAIQSLSGKPFVASVADIRTWHASHIQLATERQKLADREAVLESAERRKLCIELVTLAGRAPATVWADDKATAPKPYLASMPIADLRAMHADAVKASGGKKSAPVPAANATTASGEHQLTPEQLKICKETGADPADFAKLIALRDKGRT